MSSATVLPRSRVRQGSRWCRMPTHLAVVLPPQQRRAEPRTVPVPGIARDLRVKFASTRNEWEQAFQLVADNYQARGFEVGDADYRFTAYHALPETVVLVAKEGEAVVATFSLVPDNALIGLPLESLYRQEIRGLRPGRRLFETGSLAERGLGLREFMQVFVTLMRLGWQHMTRRGFDTTVIAVNPRHVSFYTKQHGFASLGQRRSYAAVQGAPAEAFYLDPALMKVRVPRMHQQMFGEPLPGKCLVAPRMPAELVRHFARHSS